MVVPIVMQLSILKQDPHPKKIIFSENLHSTHLKHSDWVIKNFEHIRELKMNTDLLYAINYLNRIWH